MSFLNTIKSIFGFNGVGETALNIVEKIAGTDWLPEQQADFILKYHAATKHMSVARRFIAIAFTLGFALLGLVFLCSTIGYNLYLFFTVTGNTLAEVAASQNIQEIKALPLLQLKNDIAIFLKDTIKEPMTWILSFYFIVDLGGKLKK